MALTVTISKSGTIIIRLPKSDLKRAAENLPDFEREDGERLLRPKVTNALAFAEAVLQELLSEDEVGNTPVHALFDRAFELAAEAGAEGISFPGDADYGKPAVAGF